MASTVGRLHQAPIVVHDRPSRRDCDDYVAAHRDASAYHSPEWLDVIHRAFSQDTRYLVAESAGAICGVLPLVFFGVYEVLVIALRRVANDRHGCESDLLASCTWGFAWALLYVVPIGLLVAFVSVVR